MKKLVFFLFPFLVSCSVNNLGEVDFQINDLKVENEYHIELNKDSLLSLVNTARTSGCNCGSEYMPPVSSVAWNDTLEKAARLNSDYMFQYNVLTHVWADGTDAGDHLIYLGYKWKTFGDNAAHGNMTEKIVIEGWLNSPPHCKNIMTKDFLFIGVARTENFWTMVLTN